MRAPLSMVAWRGVLSRAARGVRCAGAARGAVARVRARGDDRRA